MAPTSVYATAIELGAAVPGHIKNELDKQRVTAYWTYWDIYRNSPDIWSKALRSDEGNEISRRLVPSARTVVEATNRFLAKDPAVTPQPLATTPDGQSIEVPEEVVAQGMKLWDDFAKREEFWSKFLNLKRWMMVRGDAVFHVMADDTKPEGQRIRMEDVDPASVFVIRDPVDRQRIPGVYIVTIVLDDEGEEIAQRQAYLKTERGTIFTQLLFFESDGWDDRGPDGEMDPNGAAELKPVPPPSRFASSALLTGFDLPPQITSLPVYRYANNRDGLWGVSEMQGIESLLAGIIQTATDQDVTMALTGIGVYVTTSGKPKNSAGVEEEWVIAPASVIELESADDSFTRVAGVDDIKPMLDHSGYLESQALRTTGTPEIAVGRGDTAVAESGISLAIQFSPILAKNQEKELELKVKTDQLLYDLLNMWFPAYEGFNPEGLTLEITFGDPLPVNRKEVLEEITSMVTNKIISINYAQQLIRERLGYDIPANELANVLAEQQQLLDSTGARLEEEAGLGG